MNVQTVSFKDLTLYDVYDLQETEIKYLKTTFNIDSVYIDDYINRQQTPRIEINKDYTVVVLDFPFVENSGTHKPEEKKDHEKHHTGEHHIEHHLNTAIKDVITTPATISKFLFTQAKRKRLENGYINFFIGPDFLVVLHDEKTAEVDQIIASLQKTLHHREEFMSKGAYFLFYKVVDLLIDAAFNVVNELTNMIETIDVSLLENQPPSGIVEDISITRRNIVYFKAMIEPSISIFSELAGRKHEQFNTVENIYWTSVCSRLQKIRYRLHSSQELIEGISRSHESLLTVKTNEIIKVLTMFTAILLPLTLVTGFYGMNIVGLPIAESPDALGMLTIIMVALASVMLLVFKLRKWL